jgi:hypothetical protein
MGNTKNNFKGAGVKCNFQYRERLTWFDLSEKEQEDLKDSYNSIEESSFFRYRGNVYDFNDFPRVDDGIGYWHAYSPDSFFSGVVIRVSKGGDSVLVGTYIG